MCSDAWEGRFMVSIVCLLITVCKISWWRLVVVSWEWYTPFGFLNIIFFNSVVAMLVYSYYKSITTSPGFVPFGWEPPNATEQEKIAAKELAFHPKPAGPTTIEALDPERVRFCGTCNSFKPPRSHHCHECKRCVLRRDHHCPWVNNCVGFNNHKYFLQFLAYSSLGLSYVLLSITIRLIDGLRLPNRKLGGIAGTPFKVVDVVFYCFDYFIMLPVTIAIMSLFVYQISCLLVNLTSIEDYIYTRIKRIAKRTGVSYAWPYDQGRWANVRQILGRTVWDWLRPVPYYDGDGFSFKKIKREDDDNSCTIEVERYKRVEDNNLTQRHIHTPTLL